MADSTTVKLRSRYRANLPVPETVAPHLRQALAHVLDNPGSMVRPEIIYRLCRAYNIAEQPAEDLALAVEYFHTASLLVDDLPCMDDAMERRGKGCVHVEYGEADAILAALAIVNRAYSLAWRAASTASAGTQRVVLEFLEQYLGVGGLLTGQSMDIHYGSLPHTLETVERVAVGKTVSLIRLTLVLPALLGQAKDAEIEYLDQLAVSWGLSYQLVDDVKDTLHSSAQSGKTVSRDKALDRPNAAIVLGLENAVEHWHQWMATADHALQSLIALRPELAFLRDLRAEQGSEALTLMRTLSAEPVGEPV